MSMILLNTKLKNAINKKNPNGDLFFSLKNISINGDKKGCSGFVRNRENDSVVYISTETSPLTPGYLYRYADSVGDYTGYHNRFAKTLDDLVYEVSKLLKTPVSQTSDSRV